MKKKKKSFPLIEKYSWVLASISGVLLSVCFPNFHLGFFSWVGLVPLLVVIAKASSRKRAFALGFLTGLIFYVLTLSWERHVTYFGWLFIATFEAAFLGCFAIFVHEGKAWKSSWMRFLWIPMSWTAMEVVRSEIPILAFGWNLLGYTQTENLTVLQFASLFGVYGLGFVIVLINTSLADIYLIFSDRIKSRNQKLIIPVSLVLVVGISLIWYGSYRLNRDHAYRRPMRVAVIQGNIPQDMKWELSLKSKIIEKYLRLTEIASFDGPELIIWPEASFPGYFNVDTEASSVREKIQRLKIPTMLGAPHIAEDGKAYNSYYFLNSSGEIRERYDKMFLVPFGEYVPLHPFLSFLEPIAYTMGVSDFSQGEQYKIFRTELQVPFAVMICFENVFPNIARRFVDLGAEFLIVTTNDAWFLRSAAPYQHFQDSIMRAVENGVSIVHVANTGVSGFISYKGEVDHIVRGENGEALFVTGHQTANIDVVSRATFYRTFGHYFAYIILLLFIILNLKHLFLLGSPNLLREGRKRQ